MLAASWLIAFAAVAALAVLDKRQRHKRQLPDAEYDPAPLARLGLVGLAVAGAIAFLEPSYTGWMSVIAFAGILTIAALAYAVVAAFNMHFATRLAQASSPVASVIVVWELIS